MEFDRKPIESALKSAVRPMTKEERFEQRVSFIFGQLRDDSLLSKDDVRRFLQVGAE